MSCTRIQGIASPGADTIHRMLRFRCALLWRLVVRCAQDGRLTVVCNISARTRLDRTPETYTVSHVRHSVARCSLQWSLVVRCALQGRLVVGLEVLLKMLTPTLLDGGAEKSKVQKGKERGKIKGVYAAYGMCMSSAFGKEAK